MMSAFTVSGRLDRQKIVENKVAFRPKAVPVAYCPNLLFGFSL